LKVRELHNQVQAIHDYYELQLKMYREILKITEKITQSLNKDQSDKILDLLHERQQIIEKIIITNNNIKLHKQKVIDILHLKEFSITRVEQLVHNQSSSRIAKILDELNNILTTINQLDVQNQQELSRILNSIRSEFNKIHDGKNARQAYLDVSEQFPEPRFFDKKE